MAHSFAPYKSLRYPRKDSLPGLNIRAGRHGPCERLNKGNSIKHSLTLGGKLVGTGRKAVFVTFSPANAFIIYWVCFDPRGAKLHLANSGLIFTRRAKEEGCSGPYADENHY